MALTAVVGAAGCQTPFRPVAKAKPELRLVENPQQMAPPAAQTPRAAPRGILQALLTPRGGPTARPQQWADAPQGGGHYRLGEAYRIGGELFEPRHDPDYDRVGYASFYGRAFHGRQTANGEIFDMNALSAAHPTLPLPSYVRVTNLDNDRSVIVRVNDRGPFKRGRLIDVSRRAADMLDFLGTGTARVRVQYVDVASLEGKDGHYLVSSYRGPAIPSNPLTAAVAPAPAPAAATNVKTTERAPKPVEVASAGPVTTATIHKAPDPARFDPFAETEVPQDTGFVMPAPGASAYEPAQPPKKRKWLSIFSASFAAAPPRGAAFTAIDRLIAPRS